MDINYILVLVATIAQFILGAIWYSPLMFGKWWMEIMECTNIPMEELKRQQKAMMPFYALQLLLTLFTTINLAALIGLLPQFSPYSLALHIFMGFIVPTQIAGVIWANTKKKFWIKQICVMVSYSLVGIMLAAFILSIHK